MENNNKIIPSHKINIVPRVTNSLNITNKILTISNELTILIPYRKGNKWGFCSPDKKIVIDCIYSKVKTFRNKLAAVNIDDKWGFINEIGEIIIPFNYDAAFSFWDNYAEVISNNIAFQINIKNEQTRIFFNEDYKLGDPYYNFFGFFKKNDKMQKSKIQVNSNSLTIVDFCPLPDLFSLQLICDGDFNFEITEEKILNFNQHNKNISSIYPFYENDKFGYKRNENEIIFTAIYDDGTYFEDNLAIVQLNHNWGFINENGTQYWED